MPVGGNSVRSATDSAARCSWSWPPDPRAPSGSSDNTYNCATTARRG